MTFPVLAYGPVSDHLPEDFEIIETLGKGSNNKAYRVRWDGAQRVLRAPRRGGDNRRRGSAKWEHAHVMRADELGVGPRVFAAWYSRHAEGSWASGLYLVMEFFAHDLDHLLTDPDFATQCITHRDEIGRQISERLATLAADNMFVYDLKPGNVLVSLTGRCPEVRLIDFGREFCEWAGGAACDEDDRATPHIDMLTRILVQERRFDDAPVGTHLAHVLHATMLVLLGATTTSILYSDRRDHRMSQGKRQAVNAAAAACAAHLPALQGRHRRLVRRVLRADEVRATLGHYVGRRNAGTGRALAAGCGHEY